MGASPLLPDALVGREAEERSLLEAVAAARAGDGRVVVVQGPAGIGKTRLLQVACEAAAPHFTVLRAACAELEQDLAYGAATQLLERRLAAAADDPALGARTPVRWALTEEPTGSDVFLTRDEALIGAMSDAIETVTGRGVRTPDLGGNATTAQVTEAVCRALAD